MRSTRATVAVALALATAPAGMLTLGTGRAWAEIGSPGVDNGEAAVRAETASDIVAAEELEAEGHYVEAAQMYRGGG